MNKKFLQITFGIIFILAFLGIIFYSINQIRLNAISKTIIDKNNALMDSFNSETKDSFKNFAGLDSLKIDLEKQNTLIEITENFPSKVLKTKSQLEVGVNSPSNNNFSLAVAKLDNYQKSLDKLNEILKVKLCIRDKYNAYSEKLNGIYTLQDEISRATSFAQSKEKVTSLKTAYDDLALSAEDLPGCITLDKLTELKDSISKSITDDKLSIEAYKTNYIDPLIALYTSEDTAKISEFIDANANVSVKLTLPNLFDNSLELSIADKIIEDQVSVLLT